MNYLGDFFEDDIVVIDFTTNNAAGAAIAPSDAFEAGDIKIYKDDSDVQKTTSNGVTMVSPFDSVVGLHQVSIDTSLNTGDVGFWTAGSDYKVVLDPDTETVDGQTVVSILATFSIENRNQRGTNNAATATQVAALNDFNPATDEVDIGSVKGVPVAGVDDFKADCGLTGSRTITIQLYETATVTPIADVSISVYNSDQTLFLGRVSTDSNGQAVIGRDDGTYKLVFVKAGATFIVPETLEVTKDDTKTYFGDSIVIGPPGDPDACRVFEFLFLPNSEESPGTVSATAEILTLPYDKDTKLHSGVVIDGIYDPNTGLVYWDIVKGATVKFIIKDFINVTVVIPDETTKRLKDIPPLSG